jgi:antitoxin Phd
MKQWSVQSAKARFSELLETCLADGPQMVTHAGTVVAVLVSVGEWHRLQAAARPSLKQVLLTHPARADLPLPARGRARRRQPMVAS